MLKKKKRLKSKHVVEQLEEKHKNKNKTETQDHALMKLQTQKGNWDLIQSWLEVQKLRLKSQKGRDEKPRKESTRTVKNFEDNMEILKFV